MTDKKFTPDELANRLDAILPPNQDSVPAADDDVLVNLAIQLAHAPRPELSAEAMARIQAKVIRTQQQQYARRQILRLPTTPLLRWAAVIVIAVLFFGGTLIPAAASSLPGELLYPVKLGIEQIEVITAPSPMALAVIHLNHAERRLNEAQILLERGEFDSTLLIQGWENLAESAREMGQTPPTDMPGDLEVRATQINAALGLVLQEAQQTGAASPDEIREIRVNIPGVDNGPLPAALTPTSVPSQEPVASPTPMPTATTSAILAETATHTPDRAIIVNIPAGDGDADSVPAIPTSLPSPEAVASPTAMPTATHAASDTAVIDVPPFAATVIATRGVNVRSGPDTSFNVIAIVQPGDLVEVIGQNNDASWLYVRLGNGRTGWIAAFLLRAGNIPTNSNSAGDFGCEHPGNYCNAPGYNNDRGGNGDNGRGPGNDNANGNANGGGPPSGTGSSPSDNPGRSSGRGNQPN